MATFPTTLPKPSIMSSGEVHKAQVRTPMEAGYVQSRAKFTRSRKQYEIALQHLTDDEFDTFKAFFDNNQGGMFDWPDLGSVDYRFSEDSFSFDWVSGMHRDVTVSVEEV